MFLILDLQENIYRKVKETNFPSAGFAGRRKVGLGDLTIDISLEIQNKKDSWILYVTDYIVYGFHLCYKTYENNRKYQENLFPYIMA